MRPRVQRALLAVLVMTADAAMALSQGANAAWALAVLAPLALLVRAPLVPPRVGRVLIWIAWALAALSAVRGEDLGRPLGLALGGLAALFLTDERTFSTPRALMPAVLGILTAAGSNPVAPLFTTTAWIAAAVLALWLLSSLHLTADPWRWTGLLVLLALSAGLAHGLIVFLPWAQPHVEQATVAYITPNGAETGLAMGGRLGEVADLALSHRVLLRMWSDRPANLRAGVFTRFDGHAWVGPARPRALVDLLPTTGVAAPAVDDAKDGWCARPGAAPNASAHFARIVLAERMRGVLPAPATVDAARGVAEFARLDRFGLLVAPAQLVEEYAVRYAPGPIVEEDDPSALAESLEPPPSPDPRLVTLAQQLAAGASGPQEKIRRTVTYLQTGYRYSLHVGAFRTKDPIVEFLFDKKKGYCEYFASAAVLLLRLEGVPARYVSGLSVREGNRRGDHYVARASDSHAWAEALVPGVGWIEVDATPAADYDELHRLAQDSHWEAMLETLRSWWTELVAIVQSDGWHGAFRLAKRALRSLGPWLLLLLALAWGRRWRRRARRRPKTVPPPAIGVSPELLASLRRLETLWARSGCPRPLHRAPLEHARELPTDRVSPELRALGLDLVSCFYRGAYGGEDIAPDDVARLSRGLDDVSARIGN